MTEAWAQLISCNSTILNKIAKKKKRDELLKFYYNQVPFIYLFITFFLRYCEAHNITCFQLLNLFNCSH